MTTTELLAETEGAARLREAAVFDEQLEGAAGKVVLFGAGSLGRKVAAALRRHGIEPLAFADNNIALGGTLVDGVPAMAPAEAAGRFGEEALFVVSTFRPTNGGVRARLRELALLGCARAASFLPIGWRHDGVLPHFGADRPSRLLTNAGDLARVAGLWSDAPSRETFRRELAWRLRADFDDSEPPAPNQYFPEDILRPNSNETFLDGGAFDGDTLRNAPWHLERVLAVEPDPANAARLRAFGGHQLTVREALLGRAAGSARFNGTGTMASARSESGTLDVPVATLDEIAAGERPTFIKLDVEGDELEALKGARKTLADMRPVMAVCVYHRPEDLWTIPLFLQEALPTHRMYLRVHAWDGFELVAYAVPADRCRQPK
jgi:FkbM family methyltransferase